MNNYTLPPGIVKVCAGLVQSATTEPYLSALCAAEQTLFDKYPAEQQQEARRLVDICLDAGVNLFDTADVYSRWAPGHVGGESETLIGKWLRHTGKRRRVVLATKVGKPMGEGKVGLRPEYIKQAVDAFRSFTI